MIPQPSMFPPDNAEPLPMVRTMQIIAGALMVGVVFFLGIALFIRFGGNQNPKVGTPIVAYVAVLFTVMDLVARLIVPTQAAKGIIKQFTALRPVEDIRKIDLYAAYQTSMIVGFALLEGVAFFNVIAFIIEGQIWTLGIVAGLLAMMAATFPTFERVDGWAEDQLRQLQLNPPG